MNQDLRLHRALLPFINKNEALCGKSKSIHLITKMFVNNA